jgi:tetratricopeptide (TPR) repeat protein
LVQLHGNAYIQSAGRASPTFFPEITSFLNAQAGMNLRRPLPSIALMFADTLDSKGIEAAIAQYHSLRKENPPRYNFRESELNELGYEYLGEEKYDEAIAILQLNADEYPQSFNVYDSLGDAYEDAGKDAEAIESYRRSVAVFPDKGNYSRPKLDRLEKRSRGD